MNFPSLATIGLLSLLTKRNKHQKDPVGSRAINLRDIDSLIRTNMLRPLLYNNSGLSIVVPAYVEGPNTSSILISKIENLKNYLNRQRIYPFFEFLEIRIGGRGGSFMNYNSYNDATYDPTVITQGVVDALLPLASRTYPGYRKLTMHLHIDCSKSLKIPSGLHIHRSCEELHLINFSQSDIYDFVKPKPYWGNGYFPSSLKKVVITDQNRSWQINRAELNPVSMRLPPMNKLEALEIYSINFASTPIFDRTPKNLKSFKMIDSFMPGIPDWLNKCKELSSIECSSYSEVSKPLPSLNNLRKLEILKMDYRSRKRKQNWSLSDDFFSGNLLNIESLTIKNAGLNNLPSSIKNAEHLESLDLSGNNITTIPAGLFEIKGLKKLNLTGNPLVNLPEEFWIALLMRNMTVKIVSGKKGKNLKNLKVPSFEEIMLLSNGRRIYKPGMQRFLKLMKVVDFQKAQKLRRF